MKHGSQGCLTYQALDSRDHGIEGSEGRDHDNPFRKAGTVVLEVADQGRFDALQEAIAGHVEQIAVLEEAARKMDAMGDLWYFRSRSQVGSFGRVEVVERRKIANMTAGYIQRRASNGQTPEEILAADPEFQRLKNQGRKHYQNRPMRSF